MYVDKNNHYSWQEGHNDSWWRNFRLRRWAINIALPIHRSCYCCCCCCWPVTGQERTLSSGRSFRIAAVAARGARRRMIYCPGNSWTISPSQLLFNKQPSPNDVDKTNVLLYECTMGRERGANHVSTRTFTQGNGLATTLLLLRLVSVVVDRGWFSYFIATRRALAVCISRILRKLPLSFVKWTINKIVSPRSRLWEDRHH